MKKRIGLILLLILFLWNTSLSQTSFWDTILAQPKSRYGPNIVFNICQNGQVFKYTTTTSALYTFLKKEFDNYDEYRNYVSGLVLKKECLVIENDIELSWRFKRIIDEPTVDSIAQIMGQEEFIKFYFDNGIIKTEINRNKQKVLSVIDKLFEWNIVTRYDAETGVLYIPELIQRR